MNIYPAGKKLTQSAVHILACLAGKVKESWVIEDNLGFMVQLGMELEPIDTKK